MYGCDGVACYEAQIAAAWLDVLGFGLEFLGGVGGWLVMIMMVVVMVMMSYIKVEGRG